MAHTATFKIWRTHPRLGDDATAGPATGDGTMVVSRVPIPAMPPELQQVIDEYK